MPAACDLIIFDCDGVLVDSEMLSVRAMRSVLNDAGVPATDAMIFRFFGMKQADILLKIAEETGTDIPDDVAERLWPATRAIFERELKPMPGVTAFLERTAGLKHCVASSSNPDRIRVSLALTGLDRFFGDDVFSSHQVARGKPAPDLFLYAAAHMGADAHRCVVVEDSVFGVQAALAAGMTVYGFGGGSHIEAGHTRLLLEVGARAVDKSWDELGSRIVAH